MSYLGKKFSWKNVSDFLTDKELKMVLGGSQSVQTGEKNGCEWDPKECKCWVDILSDSGTQYCHVSTAYSNCIAACDAEECYIIA